MHGYILCSQLDKTLGDKGIYVDKLEDLEKRYNDNKLELNQLVHLEGRKTTYGRAKLESILGTELRIVVSEPDNPFAEITNKNIDEVMKYVAVSKDPAGMMKDLREFVLEMSTLEGFSSLSLDQLYQDVPKKFKEERHNIIHDDKMEDASKFVKLNALQNDVASWIQENMDPDLKTTMINSNRMKLSSLVEMTSPQMTIKFVAYRSDSI